MKNCNIRIEYYDTLPSTNSFLKEKAGFENEGLIVVANTQTKGRGRFSRKFYSPKNSGIYMSILLKPSFSGFDATLITSAAAVSVAKACEKLSSKETQIKWVNDVLINGKKICGILTEGGIGAEGKLDYVILGIGINAFLPNDGFNGEIENIAGYVFEGNDQNLKTQLINEVINQFFSYYDCLTEKTFLEEYRCRSAVIGKEITVIKGESTRSATALSIDDECRLLVKYKDKTTELLSSGEISIKI